MKVEVHYRTCSLCEANCGLEIKTDGQEILSIKGDRENPFSSGHICPKAIALQDLQFDPDRLRRPIKRVGSQWQEIPWQRAIDEIVYRSRTIIEDPQKSTALYVGNPNAHNYGAALTVGSLRTALETRNFFTSSTVDHMPQMMVARWMYGHASLIGLPDIDRAKNLVIMGGNPIVSNGSLWTVPNFLKRLKDLQRRGGKLIVIDPRRTETAKIADNHIFIRPGSDAFLLIAVLQKLNRNGFVNPGRLSTLLTGWDDAWSVIQSFDFEECLSQCRASLDDIDLVAAAMSDGPAALYGRMGTSTQMFGSVVHWLLNIVNIATANIDRVGGMMFSNSVVAVDIDNPATQVSFDRYKSRVSGFSEVSGQFPAAALAEEIETTGQGQIRSLFTLAGNPVLSVPNGKRIAAALESLELMVSIDPYLNETTRFADYILPPCGPLQRDHYGMFTLIAGVRSFAKYCQPLLSKDKDELEDWEIIRDLSAKLKPGSETNQTPREMLNSMLRQGPFAITLEELEKSPHGIDFGPLLPQFPGKLKHNDNMIDCAPDILVKDIHRLRSISATNDDGKLLLIGRRHIRSNNSWLHNSPRLVKGPNRCQLLMSRRDGDARGLQSGSIAKVTSRVGFVDVEVEMTDDIMEGVVSLPHGWGHASSSAKVAAAHPGVSINDLTDDKRLEPLTGNAAVNGVPVSVCKRD